MKILICLTHLSLAAFFVKECQLFAAFAYCVFCLITIFCIHQQEKIERQKRLCKNYLAAINSRFGSKMLDLPTNKEEAKAMQALGFAWLQQHAPEELK